MGSDSPVREASSMTSPNDSITSPSATTCAPQALRLLRRYKELYPHEVAMHPSSNSPASAYALNAAAADINLETGALK